MLKGLVVAGATVLIALLSACGGGGGEDDFPEATPFDPALAERLHAIRDRVSQVRGLPVYEGVREGIVSRETLKQYVAREFEALTDEQKSRMESMNVVLRMLRLIGPEDDLLKLYSADDPAQILGLYFERTERLVLIAEEQEISMEDELTLAHEYTHSLQDGAFNLEEFRKRWIESDLEEDGYAQYSTTLDCLVEGDATFTTQVYAEQVFGSDWREKVAAESAAGGETAEGGELPEFLQRASSFNYGDCAAFVEELYRDGGWDAVNAAYSNPPDTTEQIIDVEKYRSGQLANTGPPEDLTALLEGWEMIDSSQFGEFDVFNYALTLLHDGSAAYVAADGWGSGWSRSYREKENPDRVVVQLSLGFDTGDDLLEFLGVYSLILDSLRASVEVLNDNGDARWTLEGQHGIVAFDTQRARAEMRIASDGDALTAAAADMGLE